MIEASLYESGAVIERFKGELAEFKEWLSDCSKSAKSEEWDGTVYAVIDNIPINQKGAFQFDGYDGISIPL